MLMLKQAVLYEAASLADCCSVFMIFILCSKTDDVLSIESKTLDTVEWVDNRPNTVCFVILPYTKSSLFI